MTDEMPVWFVDMLDPDCVPPDDVPDPDARRLVEANVERLQDADGWDRGAAILCPACGDPHTRVISPLPDDRFRTPCTECGAMLAPFSALVAPAALVDYEVPAGIDLGDYDLGGYEDAEGIPLADLDLRGNGEHLEDRRTSAVGAAIRSIITHPRRLLGYFDDRRPFDKVGASPLAGVEIELVVSDRLSPSKAKGEADVGEPPAHLVEQAESLLGRLVEAIEMANAEVNAERGEEDA